MEEHCITSQDARFLKFTFYKRRSLATIWSHRGWKNKTRHFKTLSAAASPLTVWTRSALSDWRVRWWVFANVDSLDCFHYDGNGCRIQGGLFPPNLFDFSTVNLGQRDVLSEDHFDGALWYMLTCYYLSSIWLSWFISGCTIKENKHFFVIVPKTLQWALEIIFSTIFSHYVHLMVWCFKKERKAGVLIYKNLIFRLRDVEMMLREVMFHMMQLLLLSE